MSGQDGQDLEGISTGSYTVDVTDDNGLPTQETFNITTDIRELGAGVTALFPNPSQGVVVDVQGGFQGAMDFLILDAQPFKQVTQPRRSAPHWLVGADAACTWC